MNPLLKRGFWLAAASALLAGVLVCPDAAARGFAQGLRLCVGSVLPALFPCFAACSLILAQLTPRQCRAALLPLSWLGGYAVCAQLTARAYRRGNIDTRRAGLQLCLGCGAAPGFVIGCVGGLMLGSVPLGAVLFGAQLAGNAVSALVCRPLLPPSGRRRPCMAETAASATLPQAVGDAVNSCLSVCGCVVFFCTVSQLLQVLCPLPALYAAALSGVLEVSAGCAKFAALGGVVSVYGCSLCLSVLSASVWLQLAALLPREIPLRPLALGRSVQAAVSLGIVRLALGLLPGTVPVLAGGGGRLVVTGRLPPDALVTGTLFLAAVLYKGYKTLYNNKYNYEVNR